MDSVDRSYGVDIDGPTPFGDNMEGVRVPDNDSHFPHEVLAQLRASVDPLAESSNYGIELYEQTLSILSQET